MTNEKEELFQEYNEYFDVESIDELDDETAWWTDYEDDGHVSIIYNYLCELRKKIKMNNLVKV